MRNILYESLVSGSLAVSIIDGDKYLAGASGGVYALITAHLANVVSNWSEMDFAPLRLATFLLVAATDIGNSFRTFYVIPFHCHCSLFTIESAHFFG